MSHITLPDLPGILGPMAFRPETSKPLNELVEVLLRQPNSLTRGERELIATFVSAQNNCHYCQSIHGAIAAAHLDGDEDVVQYIKQDFSAADVSPKLKALLVIAGKVQQDGKKVTSVEVQWARDEGATDIEIHDTVLIAAAFCMYNRYVDGLATVQPHDPDLYRQRGKMLARDGYVVANLQNAANPEVDTEPAKGMTAR
ncbi:MAG TPA: peroxidase-related enzyme [Edaphobacter sp.]|uniref:carboxymuconolactone decarboxylase family protein n=1 Tax=Edaphobacter sp. TaxID=1934404 RepID=UPI002C241587|nr:peroxidase-related enzyme [Edaphobacter sp.]HUZ95517.1 peroxidase-related enzyme [Edaphobacter sp.]